jgi:hypothetical protein
LAEARRLVPKVAGTNENLLVARLTDRLAKELKSRVACPRVARGSCHCGRHNKGQDSCQGHRKGEDVVAEGMMRRPHLGARTR